VCNLFLRHSEGDLFVQARRRADDGDVGIGIEAVEDSSGSDLGVLVSGDRAAAAVGFSYFTSADHKDLLVLDLPCKDQAAAGLHFGERLCHSWALCAGAETGSDCRQWHEARGSWSALMKEPEDCQGDKMR